MTAVPDFGVVHRAPWLEVCFHEAGHALVARSFGIAVDHVEAYADGHGFCHYRAPLPVTPREVRECQVKSAAGGAAGEIALVMYAHQGSSEAARRWHYAVSGDQVNVADLDGRAGAIGWDRAYTEALRVLEPLWGELERVAYELSLTGRLGGTEV